MGDGAVVYLNVGRGMRFVRFGRATELRSRGLNYFTIKTILQIMLIVSIDSKKVFGKMFYERIFVN